MRDNLRPRTGDALGQDVHGDEAWTDALNPLGAGGALESEGSFAGPQS
jgi:hypothetical protein